MKQMITSNNVTSEPTVFVVEDDILVAEAIQWLLHTVHLNVELFQNAEDYLKIHDSNRRGCLIIDVRMPKMSGLELQKRLIQKSNTLPVIIITGHGDIAMAVTAMQAGAISFITKPFNDQLLLDEVQKAIALNTASFANTSSLQCAKNYKELTTREKQIMKLVVSGKLNKQIAQELKMSISTVELHRSRMMQKMEADSLAHLMKIYLSLESSNLLDEVVIFQ